MIEQYPWPSVSRVGQHTVERRRVAGDVVVTVKTEERQPSAAAQRHDGRFVAQ